MHFAIDITIDLGSRHYYYSIIQSLERNYYYCRLEDRMLRFIIICTWLINGKIVMIVVVISVDIDCVAEHYNHDYYHRIVQWSVLVPKCSANRREGSSTGLRSDTIRSVQQTTTIHIRILSWLEFRVTQFSHRVVVPFTITMEFFALNGI